MPFSSVLFIHLFLPAFLAVYWLAPRSARNGVAIAASLIFYAWGAPRFLPVVVGLGIVDYHLSHAIARARTDGASQRRARALLIAGVAVHLSVLAYFKYANFFVEQLDAITGSFGLEPMAWTRVALPIGISFITFEEISYLSDVYRGDARPARRLSQYVLFLTLFPHSIAGPIFRWKDLEQQLATRGLDLVLIRSGFERFALGLAKKVLVADSVGVIADGVFALPADQLTPGWAWLGAGAYAVQIYFDFSGYSDMAIGLGRMIGFRFKENFDRPYVSASFTEFWTRWHISLSSWLRDYLYVSLGGNRRGRRRTLVNVFIVFLLSGLWHGPAWTFVAWGAYHGTFVTVERLLGARLDRVPRLVRHASTLALVTIGWVFFRAESLGQAGDLIGCMLGVGAGGVVPPPVAALAPRFAQAALVLGALICVAPIVPRYLAWARPPATPPLAWSVVVRLGYLFLFMASAVHLTNMRITPLIYFKF